MHRSDLGLGQRDKLLAVGFGGALVFLTSILIGGS
jgi:hypothetical protein